MGCGPRPRRLDQVPNHRVYIGVWRRRPISSSLPFTSPARDRIPKGDTRLILRPWNGSGTTGKSTRYELYCRHAKLGSTRASYALCALANKTSEVNPEDIKEGCKDVSPIVRSAAVYLLQNCPALWSECSASLSVLFNDTSLDVRYVSFNLAKRMAHLRFAEEIVSGLEEDARMGRISNFAARRDALEAITGHRLPERPPYYVHGQPYHSDARRDARVGLARRWEDWLRQDRLSRA